MSKWLPRIGVFPTEFLPDSMRPVFSRPGSPRCAIERAHSSKSSWTYALLHQHKYYHRRDGRIVVANDPLLMELVSAQTNDFNLSAVGGAASCLIGRCFAARDIVSCCFHKSFANCRLASANGSKFDRLVLSPNVAGMNNWVTIIPKSKNLSADCRYSSIAFYAAVLVGGVKDVMCKAGYHFFLGWHNLFDSSIKHHSLRIW